METKNVKKSNIEIVRKTYIIILFSIKKNYRMAYAHKKSWDETWEKVYQSQSWGKYPPEELIRFIARNYYQHKDRNKIKILDLGCGTGASAWFLAREGFSTFGIDGSRTAIKIAKERFKQESLQGDFRIGDIINLDYPENYFDCVIENAVLQHNKLDNIKLILNGVYKILKHNGKLFCMMLNSKSKFNSGLSPVKDKGYFYLINENEIPKLFSMFTNLQVERSERTDRGNLISQYIIGVDKK